MGRIKKISDPNILISYLEEKYDHWLLTKDKAKRKWLEDCVFDYINNNLDDALYLEANDWRATGLCAYPNFEKDLRKIINVLNSKL